MFKRKCFELVKLFELSELVIVLSNFCDSDIVWSMFWIYLDSDIVWSMFWIYLDSENVLKINLPPKLNNKCWMLSVSSGCIFVLITENCVCADGIRRKC